MTQIHKYPRTPHLEGSRCQPGDEDLDSVSFDQLKGRYLVVTEKLDGANAGISFDEKGKLQLQSRGHFLTGGPREKQFNLFKQWANCHADALRQAIGSRYVLYGEWLYAKHTIFYDRLPHYFLAFDIFDTEAEHFLSTERRHELLAETPVVSVPVLWSGQANRLEELISLVGNSPYKSTDWRKCLRQLAAGKGLDADRIAAETDPTDLMEGLYIKVEENGHVVERYKYVRANFLTDVLDSATHWLKRPIVPNQLCAGVDLFATF